MLITVKRFAEDEESTISLVEVDGRFECFGLEDQAQKVKVAGETRIPALRYKVGVRLEGGKHQKYSIDPRFRGFHRGMLQIMEVPEFNFILIHVGNDDDDTEGCLLVGEGASCRAGHPKTIQSSARAYEALYKRVISSAEAGELEIEILDNDRRP